MSNGIGINWDKLFSEKRLFPHAENHRQYIEIRLAGMKLASPVSYAEFVQYYNSFGIPLAGVEEEPTFERARDQEKIAAGWTDVDGVLTPPDEEPELTPVQKREKELNELNVAQIDEILPALELPVEGKKQEKIAAILAKEFPSA